MRDPNKIFDFKTKKSGLIFFFFKGYKKRKDRCNLPVFCTWEAALCCRNTSIVEMVFYNLENSCQWIFNCFTKHVSTTAHVSKSICGTRKWKDLLKVTSGGPWQNQNFNEGLFSLSPRCSLSPRLRQKWVKFQPQSCRGMNLYHEVSPSVSFLSQFTIGVYYAAKCNTKLHLETPGMTVS